MMDCKAALSEAKGDLKAAQDIIRKKGLDIAIQSAVRQIRELRVASRKR
jgi:translation elongation factor EF-Ts